MPAFFMLPVFGSGAVLLSTLILRFFVDGRACTGLADVA